MPRPSIPAQNDDYYRAGAERIAVGMMPLLTCSLCQDLFVDPVTTIRCGHTFCLACYDNWACSQRNLVSPYPCALCNKRFAHLAPDWTMTKLVLHEVEVVDQHLQANWQTFGRHPVKESYYRRLS
ncbi:hypothetical protein DL93DRAFT_2083007 [Clavulina sp. PMI_390]|nr:hypothetical protein DL93DRAFT_2083007 [Clavulina sp. PMI_390]